MAKRSLVRSFDREQAVFSALTNYGEERAVRPHIPLIKFPTRGTPTGSTGAAGNMLQSNERPSLSPNASGKDSARPSVFSSNFETVPLKYRRKPISLEEMEYIERGGPE